MTPRQRLRAAVWEMTSGRCEWPSCQNVAAELAHIKPRGMGHNGYRDNLANVMAACRLHARVSDFAEPDAVLLQEWRKVEPRYGHEGEGVSADDVRAALARFVAERRYRAGYFVEGMQAELDEKNP